MADKILEQILDALKDMNSEQQKLNNQISMIESKMSTIESMMATKDDIKRIDSKLEAISAQVVENTEQLHLLTLGQERQGKALETLALRSIEQETELRELKRVK